MLDRTWPSLTTAALVSSQEVSKAKRVMALQSEMFRPLRSGRAKHSCRAPLASRRRGLLRGHFLGFQGAPFGNGGALAVERNAFEQIHRAIQLDVTGIAHAFLVFWLDRVQAARGAFDKDVMLFLV